MGQELIVGIIAGTAAVIAAVFSAPRILRDERWSINRDLDIWAKLPMNSESKAALLRKIDREVISLDIYDQRHRSPSGIGLGISFFVIGLAISWFVWTQGAWWWIASPVALAFLVFGAVGFGISIRKTLRDEKGNTIKKDKS